MTMISLMLHVYWFGESLLMAKFILVGLGVRFRDPYVEDPLHFNFQPRYLIMARTYFAPLKI
jgi:hypothetical protein